LFLRCFPWSVWLCDGRFSSQLVHGFMLKAQLCGCEGMLGALYNSQVLRLAFTTYMASDAKSYYVYLNSPLLYVVNKERNPVMYVVNQNLRPPCLPVSLPKENQQTSTRNACQSSRNHSNLQSGKRFTRSLVRH